MITQSCQIAILAVTLSLAVGAQAQTSAPALPSKRVIYVLDFHHQGVASRDDIDDFAEQLLILRLVQLKSYNVEKRDRDKEPPCLKEVRAVSLDPQLVTIGSDASYYSVKASIHVREPSVGAREATLEYELRKCRVNGVFISLAQSNQTFAYTDVLRQLNGMADSISFLLEQEQQVTKISVGFKGVSGAGWSRLGDMILDRLKDAQEFEPRVIDSSTPSNSPADYTLSGRVFSQSSKLWFEVEVRNRRGRSFKKVFEGLAQNESTDAQKLEGFYKEKSLIAIDYLSFIRNIDDTDQPQPPSDLEATEALRQSRELLCRVEPSAGCVAQASPAADLLDEVVRNKNFNKPEVWELLGVARVHSRENARAAQAFERAADLAEREGKIPAVPDLLSQAGVAWLEAQNFVAAGSVYDRLLKLSPTRPDAHLGRAKSYRYNKQHLDAWKFLLDSIVSLPDAKELKQELAYLAGSLQRTELEAAKNILKDKPSAALALPLLRRREAELILDEAAEHFEHRRYDLMDTELKKVEAVTSQLPELSDEPIMVLFLRGLWHSDARNEFDEALPLLREASRRVKARGETGDIEEFDAMIARTLWKRGLSKADKAQARTDFEKAASILTDATKMNGRAETVWLLRVVNHELGRDKESKDLIQHRIDERRAYVHDFLTLAFICNSYEVDPECGMKVAAKLKESTFSDAAGYSSLLRAEAHALRGEFELALAAQQEAVNSGQLSRSALAVAHFYGVLLQVAIEKQIKVTDSAVKWNEIMLQLRESVVGVEWVLDAALRVVEAQSIPDDAKLRLRDMIFAMQDSKKALPTLPPAQ